MCAFSNQFIIFGSSIALAVMISIWICIDSKKQSKKAGKGVPINSGSKAGYQEIGNGN